MKFSTFRSVKTKNWGEYIKRALGVMAVWVVVFTLALLSAAWIDGDRPVQAATPQPLVVLDETINKMGIVYNLPCLDWGADR